MERTSVYKFHLDYLNAHSLRSSSYEAFFKFWKHLQDNQCVSLATTYFFIYGRHDSDETQQFFGRSEEKCNVISNVSIQPLSEVPHLVKKNRNVNHETQIK
jgi:hypothetical protein